jgi:uncharacterized repeat protein (TIGR03803 family)
LGLLTVIATQTVQAQTFTVLYNFQGQPDGADPAANLVRDASGNLYGTTQAGGTVFKLNKTGNLTLLHNFSGQDGSFPRAGLLLDASGNLYGTAAAGGHSDCAAGCGVVFKLTP